MLQHKDKLESWTKCVSRVSNKYLPEGLKIFILLEPVSQKPALRKKNQNSGRYLCPRSFYCSVIYNSKRTRSNINIQQ